jgi:hypothetical protein
MWSLLHLFHHFDNSALQCRAATGKKFLNRNPARGVTAVSVYRIAESASGFLKLSSREPKVFLKKKKEPGL